VIFITTKVTLPMQMYVREFYNSKMK